MFPGLGGINPKKMQAMMKQLGIDQTEISAKKVIIEKNDGDKIIIENPSVIKIKMKGEESWQITGEESQETQDTKEEDIKIVMEKSGKTKEEAEKALQECDGDIAQAIINLSK